MERVKRVSRNLHKHRIRDVKIMPYAAVVYQRFDEKSMSDASK